MNSESPDVPDVDAIRTILRQVVDPEAGVNIVDMGLIYAIDPAPDRVRIEMTMTSPACPMGDMIMDEVVAVLAAALPAGCRPEVDLVWDPPWDPSRISEETRRHFGW